VTGLILDTGALIALETAGHRLTTVTSDPKDLLAIDPKLPVVEV